MLKIVLTGPESTGKTTLAKHLAGHYRTAWAPEFARSYLNGLGRPYERADLLKIAEGQLALEDEIAATANDLLFLDTSLEVIKIWSEFRYGNCDPWILEKLKTRPSDLYLLCKPDLPWELDPQRENPKDREALYDIYRQELMALNVPFSEIQGFDEYRFYQCVSAIETSQKK